MVDEKTISKAPKPGPNINSYSCLGYNYEAEYPYTKRFRLLDWTILARKLGPRTGAGPPLNVCINTPRTLTFERRGATVPWLRRPSRGVCVTRLPPGKNYGAIWDE